MTKTIKTKLIRFGGAKRLTKGGDTFGMEILVQNAFPG